MKKMMSIQGRFFVGEYKMVNVMVMERYVLAKRLSMVMVNGGWFKVERYKFYADGTQIESLWYEE